MQIAVSRIILYVKDVAKVAAFYQRHFAMTLVPGATEAWIELSSGEGSTTIALHKAASSQKSGAAVKIVFGVLDVDAFIMSNKHMACHLARSTGSMILHLPMQKIRPGIRFRSQAVGCRSFRGQFSLGKLSPTTSPCERFFVVEPNRHRAGHGRLFV